MQLLLVPRTLLVVCTPLRDEVQYALPGLAAHLVGREFLARVSMSGDSSRPEKQTPSAIVGNGRF